MVKNIMFFLVVTISLMCLSGTYAKNPNQPTGLMVELMDYPELITRNGYITNVQRLADYRLVESLHYPQIRRLQPYFSWIVNDSTPNTVQSAYQVQVASDPGMLESKADMWDSGKVLSDRSINIQYQGKPLAENTAYYFRVRTWTHGPSPYSEPQIFYTGELTQTHATTRYPLLKTSVSPQAIIKTDDVYFVDFGKAAFAQLQLSLTSTADDTINIHLSEVRTGDRIDRNPGGSRRYRKISLHIKSGTHTYFICIPPDERNTGPNAIKMPARIGEVLPFRYCEIQSYDGQLNDENIQQLAVSYPFDDQAACFKSSNKILNDVWELCKYSIKATSFCGVYVDGDRERIPYEADAYINQLSHYCVDREYTLARYTHEYLMTHATWPTEWIMHSVLMAWADYLYTGNPASLEYYYNDLKAKTLQSLEREDGLISTQTGLVTNQVLESIYLDRELRDIVDWPHTGILGLAEGYGGETDDFDFQPINTVVNSFHYQALYLMSKIARVLDKPQDAQQYEHAAARVKSSINGKLLDSNKGIYVDGENSTHSSLHANMFPMAFDIVPPEHVKSVAEFIKSRGMACSVYGSQYLLEALYNAHESDFALYLLTNTSDRGWAHMIYDVGSTITLEAWDNKYKPNQDWNHAWGAAPANIIPRYVMGIRPLEPGFKKVLIAPQPSTLSQAKAKVPTIRGAMQAELIHYPDSFSLDVHIPANTTARVEIPWTHAGTPDILVDGQSVKARKQGEFYIFDSIGSGNHTFKLESK